MFNRETREKTALDKAIDDLLGEMDNVTGDSTEYEKMVDQLVKLHALKTHDGRTGISSDTWANIFANLGGILIIVGHERAHLVTSKALGFIKRLG